MSACNLAAGVRTRRRRPLRATAATALLAVVAASGLAYGEDRIVAGAVGGGAVEVLWLPEDQSWPAGGWRLERVTDTGAEVIAEPGLGTDAAAIATLDADAASGIAEFADKLRRGTLSQEERESADAVFAIAAITNVVYGRALGLRFRDTGVPPGATSYRLSALDAAGAAFRTVDSEPVDSVAPAPLPHAPENVAAEIGDQGVVVSWADPPEIAQAPIAGYRVIRVEQDGFTDLTPDLHLRTIQEEPLPLRLLDREAPRDRMFAYDIASVDLLGRSSTPKRVLITLGRLAQAAVPVDLAGEAGAGTASLSWSPVAQAGVAGYVIERSLFIGGPYEAITPDGIPADTPRFAAEGLLAGTAYFFRIRIFDQDGNLGRASLPVKVVPVAAAPPSAPANLAAEAGPTRVLLTWDAAAEGVAGYFVFRQAAGETDWMRLNGTVTPEPAFVDRFERGAFSDATLSYRVQAIGHDSSAGAFSETLSVAYGDETIPPPPLITTASGDDGTARIAFQPGAPEDDSNQFLILRSEDEAARSLVRGDPLPAEARAFADPDVEVGATYWYEVVALDAAGNRSDPSSRVVVTVAAPPLPVPPAPVAVYRAEPFPHVEVNLAEFPDALLALVEARGGTFDKWFLVAGPLAVAGPVNLADLPAGAAEIAYRLVYQAANGARSAPSPETVVALP
jgi:hypothetical protein